MKVSLGGKQTEKELSVNKWLHNNRYIATELTCWTKVLKYRSL